MSGFTSTLPYLRDSVLEDLGDIQELIGAGFVDRAINEGQRRLEPDHVLQKTLTGITIPAESEVYPLPSDLIQVNAFDADTGYADLQTYYQHGSVLYFNCPTRNAWAGKLHYTAHYPVITDTAPCQLPAGACDALISFGLYRAFRRIAANRAEYRKFATIVGNGVTMADLEATAEAHLQDFQDAADSAATLPAPITLYED